MGTKSQPVYIFQIPLHVIMLSLPDLSRFQNDLLGGAKPGYSIQMFLFDKLKVYGEADWTNIGVNMKLQILCICTSPSRTQKACRQ